MLASPVISLLPSGVQDRQKMGHLILLVAVLANLAVVEVKVVEAGGRSRTSHLVVTAFTGLFSRFCGGVRSGNKEGSMWRCRNGCEGGGGGAVPG